MENLKSVRRFGYSKWMCVIQIIGVPGETNRLLQEFTLDGLCVTLLGRYLSSSHNPLSSISLLSNKGNREKKKLSGSGILPLGHFY